MKIKSPIHFTNQLVAVGYDSKKENNGQIESSVLIPKPTFTRTQGEDANIY